MSRSGLLIPPQPRVCFRNQPLLPSSAPRSVNISPVLSTLRILPVATGLPTMVGVYPSSAPLKTSGRIHGESHRRCKSRRIIPLRTLFLSLRSFPRSNRLFSIACGLFLQNTRGGGTSASLPFGINNIQPFFPLPVANVATGFSIFEFRPISVGSAPLWQPRTSAATRALDTGGCRGYGFAQRSSRNRKLR